MGTGMKPEQQAQYDRRFQTFLRKLGRTARYQPREIYLYPIMDGVPFQDLEVALDLAADVYTLLNDNEKDPAA